jgi:nucleotide-binding universal stress UspA family protein
MSALSRILVATDFSPGSGVAMARAGLLAKEHQADLRLIHASPDWNLFCRFLPAQQAHYTTLTQHAESAVQREIDWLQQRYGIQAHGGVELGSATRTIARVVQDFQPQLVVIGARGEHGPSVSSSALGGTAMKLLLQTTRPLLLVRDTCSRAYSEAMAAISDPAELAKRVVQWGLLVAPNASWHVVRAYDVPYLERLRQCGIDDASMLACASDARANAQRAVEAVLKSVESSSPIRVHLMQGEPLRAVLTQIVRDRSHLLVVGKHVQSVTETDHALVGSVGLRLAYHAQSDVLVVP